MFLISRLFSTAHPIMLCCTTVYILTTLLCMKSTEGSRVPFFMNRQKGERGNERFARPKRKRRRATMHPSSSFLPFLQTEQKRIAFSWFTPSLPPSLGTALALRPRPEPEGKIEQKQEGQMTLGCCFPRRREGKRTREYLCTTVLYVVVGAPLPKGRKGGGVKQATTTTMQYILVL